MAGLIAWLVVDVLWPVLALVGEVVAALVIGLARVLGLPLWLPGGLLLLGLLAAFLVPAGAGFLVAGLAAAVGISAGVLIAIGLAVCGVVFLFAFALSLFRPATSQVSQATSGGTLLGQIDWEIG